MEPSGLTYPGRLASALFRALEDTAGPSSLEGALAGSGLTGQAPDAPLDFTEVAAFSAALETAYGVKGGRGIALKMGGSVFEHGLRDYGLMLGVTAAEFERLPVTAQAQISLMGLAAIFTHLSDQTTRLEVDEQALYFIVDPSPFAYGRTSDKPVCHVLTGIVSAALHYATRGYHFAVIETTCRAVNGGACVFQVSKQPIGKIEG